MNDRHAIPALRHHWGMPVFQVLFLVLLCGATAVQFGCYPNDELSVTDLDLVATFRAPAANFSTKHSYAMGDTLAQAPGQGGVINRQYEAQIIDLINTNMTSLGYVK